MDKFWIVMRDDRNNYFSKRHPTEKEARQEAERLCRKEKVTFFVFEVCACVEALQTPVVWNEIKAAQKKKGK